MTSSLRLAFLCPTFTCCSGIFSFKTSFNPPPVDRDRAKVVKQCSRFRPSDFMSAAAPETKDLHLMTPK